MLHLKVDNTPGIVEFPSRWKSGFRVRSPTTLYCSVPCSADCHIHVRAAHYCAQTVNKLDLLRAVLYLTGVL